MARTKTSVKPDAAGMKRQELTLSEAEQIWGGRNVSGCRHKNLQKTGNRQKYRIGFIRVLEEEFYCPDCGRHFYERSTSF